MAREAAYRDSLRELGRDVMAGANADNPLRDYTHVYVPYCTGDLHWGNRTQTYSGSSGSRRIEHKGAVNAASAVDWAFANVTAPTSVLVAGCSAGGYGAALWSAHVMNRYPGASVAQLADSAAGVVQPGFFQTVLDSWGVESAWPSFIPSLSLDTLHRRRGAAKRPEPGHGEHAGEHEARRT